MPSEVSYNSCTVDRNNFDEARNMVQKASMLILLCNINPQLWCDLMSIRSNIVFQYTLRVTLFQVRMG